MKLQAHLPTFGIEPRDWHAATIALISLFGAVALLLTLQSGSLLDNPLLGRMTTSPIIGPQTSVSKRISLGLRLWDVPISPWERFSVAHPLPPEVASAQRFSIGKDDRAVFEVSGDAALRKMLAENAPVPQLKSPNDRLMLMLMLLQFNSRRS